MKLIKTFILTITALLAFASLALAQTNTTPQQTFIGSLIQYFGTINTNYTFEGAKLEISTGIRDSSYLANYVLFQYNLPKKVDFEVELDNTDIAGTVIQAKAGIGYTLLQKYDTKLQAGLLGGWDFDRDGNDGGKGVVVVEPRLMLRKKATENTYFETGLGWPIYVNDANDFNRTPSVMVGAGFTY